MSLSNFVQNVLSTLVTAQEGPAIVIAHPGQDVELICAVTPSGGQSVSWYVNHDGPYGVNALLNGLLPGYSSNEDNLIVENIMMSDSRNGSDYSCVIVNTMTESNPTALYVAGEFINSSVHLNFYYKVL